MHAVSSAKPVILLWCTTSTWASPRFWLTAFQSHLEKSFTATTNLLIPATPLPCVLRSVPVAALDHLRGGESILPLPQPASLSDAEITLRDLVETTQDVDRVQHLWKEVARAESLRMVGRGRCHQMSEEEHRQLPSAIIILPSRARRVNCSYAPHLKRVKEALKVKGEGSPVMTVRWRYHKRQQKRTVKNGLHGSPSVRPSPKAID